MKKLVCVFITLMFFSISSISAYAKILENDNNINPLYTSFRDIPGVTKSEIAAIEALRDYIDSFSYGMTLSTEAFYDESGGVGGYAALFCDWLSELFGIPFVPEILPLGEINARLKTGELNFSGTLTPTAERRETHYMASPIAERSLKYFRLKNSVPLTEIQLERLPRFAFLENSIVADAVLNILGQDTFEMVWINNPDNVYELLINNEIDAYIHENHAEAYFINHNDMITADFLPITVNPVSMATLNPLLRPVTTIVQKAIENGEMDYLNHIYLKGYDEYMRHILFSRLSEEEKAYLRDNEVIKYVTQYENYPVSFYSIRDEKWQGIAFDLLREVEKLTGLRFELAHGDEFIELPVLLEMMEKREASFITELIRTEARLGKYIWPGTNLASINYTLVSRLEQKSFSFNEVKSLTVGIVTGVSSTDAFKRWFPEHAYTVEYGDMKTAFIALGEGKLDLVMTDTGILLNMTNWMEMTGFRANIIFDSVVRNSSFGMNIDEEILCSIIDKAFDLIDVQAIADDWRGRTFDYRYKVIEAQRPWLIGAFLLLLCVIFLLIIIVRKNRSEGKRLEDLVKERTNELKESAEKLTEALMEARNASKAKTEFLSNMSHEIRTPMNAILGMAELLLHESLDSRQISYVNDIHMSGQGLLAIINDILDMSKIEAGKLELAPVNYDFNAFLDNLKSMFSFVAEKKNIEFRFDPSGDLPSVLVGDDNRLRQVLTNICGNAVKFTEHGYVRLKVSRIDKLISFEIKDTGKGIKKEDMGKLFSAFSQVDTHKNRNIVGTGLGLAISKSFVEMMGGSISFESEYGEGTIFTILIPAIEGKEENVQLEVSEQKKASVIAPDANILVVDDNVFNLRVAEGLLQLSKIKAITASSGTEAIELIKKNDYDIVFMDHMMPEMDGVEATKAIRELGGKYEKLIIIALTANAIHGAREMYLASGFSGFISKPINLKGLNETLMKYLPPGKIMEVSDGS